MLMDAFKFWALYIVAIFPVFMTGCNGGAVSSSGDVSVGVGLMNVDAVPYCDENSQKWGLMGLDGDIVVDARYDGKPTIAVCGRYWIEDEDGMLSLYGIDGERVVDEVFTAASEFYSGRAFVTPADGEMMVIDKSGNKVVSLGKIGGKMPELISDISEGVGIYRVGKYSGAVDVNGNCVVPAEYVSVGACRDGKMVACVDKKFAFSEYTYDVDNPFDSIYDVTGARAKVFDCSGKELVSISSDEYQIIYDNFFGDFLPVASRLSTHYGWGFIDVSGRCVMAPDERVYTFFDMRGDKFIYGDSTMMCGVMDIRGKEIIKAEYDFMQFVSDSLLVAQKPSGDGQVTGLLLIDMQGRVILDNAVSISLFFPTAYNRAVIERGDGVWSFVDAGGTVVGTPFKAADVNHSYYGSETIPSAAYIKSLTPDR